MSKRTVFRCLLLVCLINFGIYMVFLPSISFSQDPLMNTREVMEIKVKDDFLSVKLENAPMREVLREIAHQTGLTFEGLENAEGRVTQEFKNIPLDEGLRKISQSFIMIFKKTGKKGAALRVEKVIIIAKKGLPEDSPAAKLAKKSKPLVTPPLPRTPSSITKSETIKPQKITPSIPKQEVERKKRTPAKVQKQAKADTKAKVEKKVKAKKKAKVKVKERMKAKEKVKKKTKARVAKKITPAAITKPKPRPSSISSDLSRGEKYFKEKRWDRAMKYFKKYLEQNPSDEQMREKYNIAKENAARGISLYKQAKKMEREEEFKDAYQYYKKSYEIYPLLYDTWERMRAIKKKINR